MKHTCLALVVLLASAARSEPAEKPGVTWSTLLPVTPALTSMYYDLSAVYQRQGFGFAEGPMTLTGVRFVERGSGLGKLTAWLVTQLFMAFGEAAAGSGLVQKHLGTTYGPGYRIDYYQRFSEEEVAAMRQAREESGDRLLSSNMSMDLQLYLPLPGQSRASGFSAELAPFTLEFVPSGEVGLEVAFAYTKLGEPMEGTGRWRTYESLGVPFRLMANWRFVQLQLQWTLNILGGWGFDQKKLDQNYQESLALSGQDLRYTNSPLSLSVSLHPLRWLFVRATGSWNRYLFNLDSVGFQLEAGVRL